MLIKKAGSVLLTPRPECQDLIYAVYRTTFTRNPKLDKSMHLTFHCGRLPSRKLLLIMRLTIVLLLAATFQVSAGTYSQKLTITGKNLSLVHVFELIKQQTGYAFVADQTLIARAPAISLQVKDAPLEEVLDKCLQHLSLTYTISDKIIVIARTNAAVQNSYERYLAPADDRLLQGVVQDENKKPLQGAVVRIAQLNKTVQTDARGYFSFEKIPAGKYTLMVTSVGFEAKEETITLNNTSGYIQILLQASVNKLEETVVKGYYQTSRKLNTGNVASVTSEDIAKQPVSDPLAALQGRVAGLFITSTNGLPGARFNISLRGQNSIDLGNDPLVIVDGVPFYTETLTTVTGANGTQSPLSLINPADIERIDVLKDADATAIYGSRGANGVMLITTKKGKAGKARYNFSVYSGASKSINRLKMLNTSQYLEMRKEAYANDGTTPEAANAVDVTTWGNTESRDWFDYMVGSTAKVTEATGSVSGGTAQSHYLLSGSFRKESTVLRGNPAYQRAAGHLTADHTSEDGKFFINASVSYSRDNNNSLATALSTFYNMSPNYPLFNASGDYYWFSNEQNPEAYLLRSSQSHTSNIVANSNIRYTVLPGLNIKANLGYNQTNMGQTQVYPDKTFNPNTSSGSMTFFGNNELSSYILEPQGDYTHRFGSGTLQLLAGATWQQSKRQGYRIDGSDFASDDLLYDIKSAGTLTPFSSVFDFYRYTAVFGRVNYNVADKYIVNATFRRDGSTRFGPDRRFGNFAAAGAAWIFSNETFMQQQSVISFGKLRASYGSSGNDQIGDYAYLSSWEAPGYPYDGNAGLTPTRFDNPYYQWERTRKLEGGLELGFIKDRVLLSTSFYRNLSDNQLVQYALSPQAGRSSYTTNLPAKILNTGWEFELNTTNVKSKDWNWKTSLNLTISKNKLQSFPGFESSAYAKTYVLGQDLTIVKGYLFTGVNTQTGIAEFADLNGNTVVSETDDYVVMGKTTPDYFGGLQNSITYKNFQLDFLFQFVKQEGPTIRYGGLNFIPGYGYRNQDVSVLNRWQKAGDVTDVPKLSATAGSASYTAYQNYYRYSTAAWGDASYIRLKNLYLKYNLSAIAQKWHLGGLNVYVQAQNLFTFTDYLGFDPETQGVTMPPVKTFTAGLQLSF